METDINDEELSLHNQYRRFIRSKTNEKLKQGTLDRFLKWSDYKMQKMFGKLAACDP